MIRKVFNKTGMIIRYWFLLIKKNGSICTSQMTNLSLSTEIKAINGGNIRLGKMVTTLQRVSLVANGGELTIGEGVGINRNCIFICRKKIVIGEHCAFGPNVVIFDHDHTFDQDGYHMDEFKTTPVIIEKNCWVGGNVTFLRGAHVGEGSVIGAGCIIKGEIPAHSLVKPSGEVSVVKIQEKNDEARP